MKHLLFIIIFLLLGLIANGQVFHSNQVELNKQQANGYMELILDLPSDVIICDLNGRRVYLDLVKTEYLDQKEDGLEVLIYTVQNKQGRQFVILIFWEPKEIHISIPAFNIYAKQVIYRKS